MSKNYVNNTELLQEIIISKQNGELTDTAVNMLLLMVDRIQMKFSYEDHADKEDCRAAAIESFLCAWHKCDTTRSNPFSWFTQVIKNGMYAGWNELVKRRADFSTSNIFMDDV